MQFCDYTEKSIIVYGESSRGYSTQLKNLGGRFNGNLKAVEKFEGGPGWIFPKTKEASVKDFLERVAKIESEPKDEFSLPAVIMVPKPTSSFQMIKWKVFRPEEGMGVTISIGGKEKVGKVIRVESNKDVVDTAYIDINEVTSKLVITNGKWQVWGCGNEHMVKFK